MPRVTYTQDEKENALRLCDEIGVLKASEQTGISTNSLYKWRTGVEAEAKSIADVDATPVDDTVADTALVDGAAEESSIPESSVGEAAGETDDNLNAEVKTSGRRYTAKEKREAVRLCEAIGITKASKQTGITINSLRKWRMDAKEEMPAAVASVPVKIAEQKGAQADNEVASTDILARLSKAPVEEAVAEDAAADETAEKAAGNESASAELIRLRVENAAYRAQIAALKNALRVFTN